MAMGYADATGPRGLLQCAVVSVRSRAQPNPMRAPARALDMKLVVKSVEDPQ